MAITATIKNHMIQATGTTSDAHTEVIGEGQVVLAVHWYGTIAIGDKISLEDGDSNTFCDMECITANQSQALYFSDKGYRVKGGIYSSDFDSGSIRIQIK